MYGQQFQNPIASAAKWMFFGFFGIILMAVVLGANIKDATWFNPGIAAAEVSRMNIETAHQQATYDLQEQLAKAQTEAEIQQTQRDQKRLDAQYDHDIQALALDLEHRDLAFKTWMNILTFAGGAFSIAIIIGTFLVASSKAWKNMHSVPTSLEQPHRSIPPITKVIQPLPERESYYPVETPARRYERRIAERLQELTTRENEMNEIIARMHSVLDPARMSKEEYNKYPLAG